MFVRKKPNKSGSVSVQVIDKSNGYRVVKTIGWSDDPDEIQRLVELDKLFVTRQSNQHSLFPQDEHGNGQYIVINKGNGRRLIVSYSDKRTKKRRS